jgi:hypothetical protein
VLAAWPWVTVILRNPGSTLVDGQRSEWRQQWRPPRRRRRPQPSTPARKYDQAAAMFLSEFSIKRPMAMIVIIIG